MFNTYKIKYVTVEDGYMRHDFDIVEADSRSEAIRILQNRYPGCRQIKRMWIERPATWDEIEIPV